MQRSANRRRFADDLSMSFRLYGDYRGDFRQSLLSACGYKNAAEFPAGGKKTRRDGKEETMSSKIGLLTLAFAGALSCSSFDVAQAAAFPNDSSAVKAALQSLDNVVEVRGRGGGGRGGFAGGRGGFGGGRGGFAAGRPGGGGRWAGGGRPGYGGGGRYAGRYGGYGRGAAWGAAAVGAAAAYGASGYYGSYYNSAQCGYYPYPACPY
jgi:hypothetical protein